MSVHFYRGAMFPARYRDRAFVTLHGYRAAGHRLVTIPFGADGAPAGPVEDFISGWEQRPARPQGHLMGLAEGPDGALFVGDNVNHAVYEVAFAESALAAPGAPVAAPAPAVDPAEERRRCDALATRAPSAFAAVERDVLDPVCVVCHAGSAGGLTLRRCALDDNFAALVHGASALHGAYLVPGDPAAGYLMARLHGDTMGPRMPLAPLALTAPQLGSFEAWVRDGAAAPAP
jgi:hypothetical protein